MVHELAHMWFGDSVSPYEWSDLWLNEGHASWYEFLYAEENGFLEGDTENYPDETGYATMDELMRAVYAHGDEWRARTDRSRQPSGTDVNGLFSLQVYHGGALVLYALRQKIGVGRLRPGRARLGRPLPRQGRGHRRLHRARGAGLRPRRRRAVPARLALRDEDAADAGPPGLDDERAGHGAGEGGAGAQSRRRHELFRTAWGSRAPRRR